MKKKYFASYCTNNCSTIAGAFEYTSKREAIASIRQICKGETFAGCEGRVTVCDADGRNVYSGTVR